MTGRAAVVVLCVAGCNAQLGEGTGDDNFQVPDAKVYRDAGADATVDARPCMGGTMAQVTKSGDTWTETDTRDGKTIGVFTFSVGPDGKLHAENVDPRDGSKMTYTASRS